MILTLNHKASSCTKLHHFSLCRGVGCIFFEMATGRPFFPGSTVEDQLHLIFKVRKARFKPKWFASHANVTTRVCSDHILIGYLETEAIIDWLHKFDVRIFFFRLLELQLKIRGRESQVMKFFSRVNTSIALFLSEARLCGLFLYFVAFAGRFPYYPKEHLINHSPRYSLCIAELFSSSNNFWKQWYVCFRCTTFDQRCDWLIKTCVASSNQSQQRSK